jgi:hypothetical protein
MPVSLNLRLVQDLYSAFAASDRARLLEILDSKIEWIQSEGFPNGGLHTGVSHVLNEVLGQFRRHWRDFRANVTQWLDAGEEVVAIGEYVGTFAATGRSVLAAFAHVYTVRHGRIVRFRQYTDTALFAKAMNS